MAATWILLRGLAREAAHWGPFPDMLARASGARVRCLDLPGVGSHREWPVPLSVAAMTDRLRSELVDDDGERRLLAISLGGMVGIDWVDRYPGDFARAAFVNTTLRGVHRWHERFRPAALSTLLQAMTNPDVRAQERAILELTAVRPFGPSDIDERVSIRRDRPIGRSVALRQLLAAARFTAPKRPLRVPALVIVSAQDRLASPRLGPTLAAKLGAAYVEHPWAGHDLPFDDPAWLVGELVRWADAR
jgi:pimeloyl-ACP methyl ester carboxylesterase